MPTQTKDRRRDPRVTAWSPLVLADGSKEPLEAQLRNLSMAGLSCVVSRELAEMTQLGVHLELPPSAREEPGQRVALELRGVVVRCRPLRRGSARRRFEVAIFFPELDASARQTLEQYIQTRLGSQQ